MRGARGRVGKRVGRRGTTYYFVVDAPRKAGKRRQLWRGGFRTKREAHDALHQVVSKLRAGDYVEPSKLTLRAFLEEVWLPAVTSKLRPATFESYSRNLRVHVLPEVGDAGLQELTALDLDRLYARLLASGHSSGRGLSPRTVRYVHTIIHAALDYAARKNLVSRNVAKLADPPPNRQSPEPLVWKPDELRSFLDSVRDDRLYALWFTLATTGMRRGEILVVVRLT